MRFTSVLLCFLVLGDVSAPGTRAELKALYNEHRWFELRDAVTRTGGDAFYRGAVECAFSQLSKCEGDLQSAMRSADRQEAIEAHRILISVYFRTGQYKAAKKEAHALLALSPDDSDAAGDYPLLELLGESPDQVAQSNGNSSLHIQEHGLPVLINAKPATYWFDTGANLSVMSESEARRLGLLTRKVESKVGVMSGAKVAFRVAVANDVQIGKSRLQNVAFLVFSDGQQPFSSLPEESRGLLGMPVLLALGQVSFGPDRQFEITPKSIATSSTDPNLCFDGKNPVTLVEYAGRQLSFTLDTGATNTDLYPPFAGAFPGTLRRGEKAGSKVEGVGSTGELNSVILPNLTLNIDHFSAVLRPATVLLKENGESSKYFYGNLGIDLLMQPRQVIIDFKEPETLSQESMNNTA